MSCAQVMYQPYAGSPYSAPSSTTPHPTPSSSTDPHHQHTHPQPPTTQSNNQQQPSQNPQHQSQQQQQNQIAVSQNSQDQQQQSNGSSSSSSSVSLGSTPTAANTPTTPNSNQQQQLSGAGTASSASSAGVQETARVPSRTSVAPYRAASNGSATGGDIDAPPEKKLCSERQTPLTPTQPLHPPYHPLHHHVNHHHHHHHLLNHHHNHLQHHHNQLQPHHHHNQGAVIPGAEQAEDANHSTTPTTNDVRYVSANCVVVTHYRGDTAAMVDEHFTRALAPTHCEKPALQNKAASPMSSRNFPPSFWNSNYTRTTGLGHLAAGAHAAHGDALYDPYHAASLHHSLQNTGHHDPWTTYSLSSQAYSHRSMAHDMYQAAMSSSSPRPYHQYGTLGLQPSLARIPALPGVPAQMSMTKPESWGRYHEAFTGDLAAAHGLDGGYPTSHYSSVAAGLESAVQQEAPKDLYWF